MLDGEQYREYVDLQKYQKNVLRNWENKNRVIYGESIFIIAEPLYPIETPYEYLDGEIMKSKKPISVGAIVLLGRPIYRLVEPDCMPVMGIEVTVLKGTDSGRLANRQVPIHVGDLGKLRPIPD